MTDITCPYCDHDFDPGHDDGHGTEEDETYQQECPECEKTFTFTVSWWPTYSAVKADCLNGADHDWQPIVGSPKEYYHGMERCSSCTDERSTDPEGRQAALRRYAEGLGK